MCKPFHDSGKYQRRPKVNLKNPDITVIAEILGPIVAIGIFASGVARGSPKKALIIKLAHTLP